MKLRFRMLALAICLCALLTPVGSAEVADWADSQTSSQFEELRIQNQREALGVEVNTAVKAKDITGRCSIKVSTGDNLRDFALFKRLGDVCAARRRLACERWTQEADFSEAAYRTDYKTMLASMGLSDKLVEVK